MQAGITWINLVCKREDIRLALCGAFVKMRDGGCRMYDVNPLDKKSKDLTIVANEGDKRRKRDTALQTFSQEGRTRNVWAPGMESW